MSTDQAERLVIRDVAIVDATAREPEGRVGPWQGRHGEELMYKTRVLGAHGAIISATRVDAELFMLEHEIGTVEASKRTDLVLVKGQPLDDIALVAEPDNVFMVLQDGRVVKDSEGRLTS